MNIKKIWAVWFSPTGGTKNVVLTLAGCLAESLDLPCEEIDFTLPEAREREYHFGRDDLVVAGSPVYAGRMPNKLMPDWRRCVFGEETIAVPVVVFGNRSFGGALTEFREILGENGFLIPSGAAFVSRHAFTDAVAGGRPDDKDTEAIKDFADLTQKKLADGTQPMLPCPEKDEIPPYYTPLKEDGTPAKFLKARPETDSARCDRCGICVEVCPVGSINEQMQTDGICIKCQACVRTCPKKAKYFTDEDFLSHVRMLEKNFREPADNYFIL